MAKVKRPKMETKEELLIYLTQNQGREIPFNEDVWNIAVEKTQDKERKYKETSVTDFDGKTKKKVVPNGAINPVSKYFALMALPQYQKKAKRGRPQGSKNKEPELDGYFDEDDDFSIKFDDEEKNEAVSSWINIFFAGYDDSDKKFLKERLGDYYDNYELNEGADKLLVVKAVADELEIMKLTMARAKNKDVEARIEKVQKGFLSLLESLKALKKQRGSMEDEGKNKLTLIIDELEKAGEFKPSDIEYPQDQIDAMLDTFTKQMMVVLRDG